jgi:serine/threonine-protein kinase
MSAGPSNPSPDDPSPSVGASDVRISELPIDSDRESLPVNVGEIVADRYAVDGILASGGMGLVCRAHHVELEQPVAIKFLRRTFAQNDALVLRFLEEARAAAALTSQHVVRVIDVGQLATGVPYLVMEHLEGTDLETVVQREGRLDPDRAVDYVLEACEALKEAHAAGIVHRDIKPENLFVTTRGSQRPILKVVDFGIAKRLDASRAKIVTGPQDQMGSPCYMSPEQMAAPHKVDERTDVWSLGVVLYRLLTGTLPFDGDSIVEIFARVVNAPVRPLFEVQRSIDPHLDAIVRRCLEKDPALRFPSIAALADALTRYRAGALSATDPVVSRRLPAERFVSEAPVAAPPRARGSGRGNAWTVIAAVAFLAALAGGLRVAAAIMPRLDALANGGTPSSRSPLLGSAAAPFVPAPADYVVGPAGELTMKPEAPFVLAEHEPGTPIEERGQKPQPKRKSATRPRPPEQKPAPSAAPPASVEPPPAAPPAPAKSEEPPLRDPAKEEPPPTEDRERAYQEYLKQHGWRPLREVLEELRKKGELKEPDDSVKAPPSAGPPLTNVAPPP